MTAERPPVLVVPGWSDTARQLRTFRSFLLECGWRDGQVACLSFRDRFGSNIEHSEEIAEAVARLRAGTGRDDVAVVAHSMGGLALRHHLMNSHASVRTAIFVGTPHHGTWAAWLAWGRGGAEMRPGSSFLRELNRAPLPAHVRAFCLRTPIDTRVLLPGQGVSWTAIDDSSARATLANRDGARRTPPCPTPRPPRCPPPTPTPPNTLSPHEALRFW